MPAYVAESAQASELSTSSSVKECTPLTAISVVESALTDEMLRKYRVAYKAVQNWLTPCFILGKPTCKSKSICIV